MLDFIVMQMRKANREKGYWISWNYGYALDGYQIHKINTVAGGDHGT